MKFTSCPDKQVSAYLGFDVTDLTAAWVSDDEKYLITLCRVTEHARHLEPMEDYDYVTMRQGKKGSIMYYEPFSASCCCAKDGSSAFIINEFMRFVLLYHTTPDEVWHCAWAMIKIAEGSPGPRSSFEESCVTLTGFHAYREDLRRRYGPEGDSHV